MYDLLEGWLRHKSDMVNYEAARAICEMRNVTASQLTRSVSGRQINKKGLLRTLTAGGDSTPDLPVIPQTYSQVCSPANA